MDEVESFWMKRVKHLLDDAREAIDDGDSSLLCLIAEHMRDTCGLIKREREYHGKLEMHELGMRHMAGQNRRAI